MGAAAKRVNAAEIACIGLRFRENPVWKIDVIVERYAGRPVDVVAAVGGGSLLDAGKGVPAMLPQDERVTDYLEGVGNLTHDGQKVPFIGVPTTAGTGSEVTKNAVISRTGENGLKIVAAMTISCWMRLWWTRGWHALAQKISRRSAVWIR